jgi:hypothetical protein
MKKPFYILAALALLAIGAFGQYAWTMHAAMAQPAVVAEAAPSQNMMLAAQMGDMKMSPAEKPAAGNTGMSGCGMGGSSSGMGSMDGMGDMKGGMGGMGCPMMAKGKDGKGMSGCCCANMMDMGKDKPKKPA